jgi:hypothetical protein
MRRAAASVFLTVTPWRAGAGRSTLSVLAPHSEKAFEVGRLCEEAFGETRRRADIDDAYVAAFAETSACSLVTFDVAFKRWALANLVVLSSAGKANIE